jgi:hypothetical protein
MLIHTRKLLFEASAILKIKKKQILNFDSATVSN